jgi:diguanylate cyclase (GGDEF)-like protein
LIGGGIIGVATSLMHYLGIASLRMPADIVWMPDLLAVSIVCGVGFGALSLFAARHGEGLRYGATGAALLVVAILSDHFIAMSAIGLIPDISALSENVGLSPVALSVGVASVMAAFVVACLISAISDRRSRRDINERNIQLNAAIDNMMQGLCMFGPDNCLQLWNEKYVAMYKLAPKDIRVGMTVDDMFAARKNAGTIVKDLDSYSSRLWSSVENREFNRWVLELVDGRTISVSYQSMENGGWVGTHEDITEQRKSEAQIQYLAQHDSLTGLFNRSAFNDHVRKVWEEAVREQRSFTILSLDIDRFGEINDTYGHSAGDIFLDEAARRLQAACGSAFIARLGGDEFMIVSSEGEQPARAGDICTRVLTAFEMTFHIDGHAIHSSCTVGVSIFPQDGADVETLITNADVALYRAKKEERGSIRFFEPAMDKQIREKRALLHDLGVAIENEQLELHYQPQSSPDGSPFGFEALVRWRHPVKGLIAPGVFITLAEEGGSIVAIDGWILREACREAASWPKPMQIAINVSPTSFQHNDLPGLIHSILLETGLNPRRLEIEITEGVLMQDFSHACSILRRIKNLGVRIAMDDFGTGYSSLSYLQSFPFDKIKIDQTFVAQIHKNVQSSAIIRAIISLGEALNLGVIAEGVETDAQRDFLADAGCVEMQGYLLGRPQPIGTYGHIIGRSSEPSDQALAG